MMPNSSIEILNSIDNLIEKAKLPKTSGAYLPIRVVIRKSDGTIGTAIRWKSSRSLGIKKIFPTSLASVRSIKQIPAFTKFSFIKQTLFTLADDIGIEEIEENNFVPVSRYACLGDGVYLYNDINIAKERAEDKKEEIVPVKILSNKIFYLTFEQARTENIENIKNQGYDAIVLMRNTPYKFDVFCFNNKNIAIIGYDKKDDTDEIRKAVEENEFNDNEIILTKDDLYEMQCFSNNASIIEKGVIKTPLRDDGGIDWDKVPKDGKSSIWITATKPGSPLEGRHILVTRRPDGLFAITGGAGFKQVKDAAGVKSKIDAFRHLVIAGRPEKTKADKELDKIREENEKANEPLIEKRKELMHEGREQIERTLDIFDKAIGVEKTNPVLIRKHRDEIAKYAIDSGLNEDDAYSFSTTAIRHYTRTERQVRELRRRETAVKMFNSLRRMKEGEDSDQVIKELNKDLEFRTLSIDLPSPKQFEGMTEQEIDSKIGDVFDEKFAELINPNPLDKSINKELNSIGIELKDKDKDPNIHTLEVGESIKPLEIKNETSLHEAFDSFKEYQKTRKEINEYGKRIKKIDLTETTPTMLEKMKFDVKDIFGKEITDEEIAEIERSYDEQWQYNNNALSFYRAVGEFWNDNTALRYKINRTDNGFGGYINSGANSALAAITGKYLGERIEVASLIDKTSIEAASLTIAYNLRDKLKDNPKEYNAIIKKIEEYNSVNQVETEKRALERHATLKKRYETLQEAKAEKLLTIREETGMVEGEIENLIEQKKNLGTALGSMEASAAFLHALYVAKDSKDNAIEINFGEDKNGAEMRERELNLGSKAMIDVSDLKNIKLITGARSLRRYMKSLEVTKDIYDENEEIKNNISDKFVDDEGNTLAKDYKIPLWKDSYIGKDGKKRKYYSRIEQRNDIEFLKKMGNGSITRVTGAGKTNTALGFFANKVSENPKYSGLIVVPKGRTGQWIDEAKMFTDLNMVLIPEGINKEERAKIIANIKPGQIAVTSQKDAIVSYYDLEAAFTRGDLRGMVLDEPQEVASRSISGNMSATIRKLTKLPSENRITLTATPARNNLIEAYDLVNWVSHHDKRLGPRTRFQRVYGGYGSGTNAQDATLQQMIFREISPYISGGKLTNPSFKVNREDIILHKTEIQNKNMKEIESRANEFIKNERDKFINEIEHDPAKRGRWVVKFGERGWRTQAAIQSNRKAKQELLNQHENNLSGILDNMTWKDNPKIDAVIKRIDKEKDKKHVIFVDSASQRKAITEGLFNFGFIRNQIKNIALTTTKTRMTGTNMSRIVKDFRSNPDAKVIFIDRASCSGYNLQEGDDLHVVGSPPDAATYLQAQGRLLREPRKGDVRILTYKYDDVPFDDTKWTKLENQIAILKAVAPGMFVE